MFPQDSTLPSNTAPVASPQEHAWNATGPVPKKPDHFDYGYVIKGQTYSSTREQLPVVLAQRLNEIRFVWTPETPEPVFPEQVAFLSETFRRHQVKDALRTILISLTLVALGVIVTVLSDDWNVLYRNILIVLGAVGITEGIWRYKLSRNYTQEDAVRDASAARFAAWLGDKNLSGYTLLICACIVTVLLGQAGAGIEESVNRAGLVKPAVWDGEIWRLFTSTLMHGDFLHFLMNFYALVYLAKMIEQTLERAFVPLVFLLTGAIGSVFSVLLSADGISVGASGGLMGLLGFITISAYLDRTKYPPKYFRLLIEWIVLVGVFGLFGIAFIDNAAHLGGLAGGLMLGWLFSKRTAEEIKTTKLLKFAGVAALFGLVLVTAGTIYKMGN